MTILPKTRLLAVIFAILLAMVLLDRGPTASEDTLPRLPALPREDVRRIELSAADDKLVLVQEGGRWKITAPYQADADQQAVKSLLMSFRKELPVDVLVDSGNDDKYGLEPGKGIVAEFWTTGEEPAASFTVGNDASGGTTFVRLSGAPSVYRARIGGRVRFDKPQTEWRNKVLLDVPPTQVQSFQLQRGDAVLSFVRGEGSKDKEGNTIPGPWGTEPSAPWPLDQTLVNTALARLAAARAGALLPQDATSEAVPQVEVVLTLDDATTRTLRLYRRERDQATLATGEGYDDVFRVADTLLTALPRVAEDVRDRSMLRFSRADVDLLSLEEAGATTLLRQDLATRLWAVVQPNNVDIDVKLVYFGVNTLAELSGEADAGGVGAGQAGLSPPASRVAITFVRGASVALELGTSMKDPQGRTWWYARREGASEIWRLSDETMQRIRAAFGKG